MAIKFLLSTPSVLIRSHLSCVVLLSYQLLKLKWLALEPAASDQQLDCTMSPVHMGRGRGYYELQVFTTMVKRYI